MAKLERLVANHGQGVSISATDRDDEISCGDMLSVWVRDCIGAGLIAMNKTTSMGHGAGLENVQADRGCEKQVSAKGFHQQDAISFSGSDNHLLLYAILRICLSRSTKAAPKLHDLHL